jgi:uncharacterized protein (DUF2252 family)
MAEATRRSTKRTPAKKQATAQARTTAQTQTRTTAQKQAPSARKKVAPARAQAPAKKQVTARKQAAPRKQASARKQTAPGRQAPPRKQVSARKQAPPSKKASARSQAAPRKQAAPSKQAPARKRTAQAPASRRRATPPPTSPPSRTRPRGVEHLSREDRVARGKDARLIAPLASHADIGDGARDPIGLLLAQADSRVPELVPIRHGRMLVSPFTFYRGAALPMAADLASTTSSGLQAQLCGDAHLSNFGAFASPERNLVFDVNDFDETLPGPFEWDVKRLAASLSVAGRANGFSGKERRRIALAAAAAYRNAMRDFANQARLSVWYAHLDIEQTLLDFQSEIKAKRLAKGQALLAKARTHDSMQAQAKLTTMVDGQRHIVNDPPTIVPVEEIFADVQADDLYKEIRSVISKYSRTLQSDRRRLLEQFTLARVARKVVGVGSVGTRAWIVLMETDDGEEPLFLQAKEAQESVLARFARGSRYENQGERVVAGQHLMQAQSDIFLGWTRVRGVDGIDRDFYVRQLRDWKFSLPIEEIRAHGMELYGRLCGWTLARAHARSGDRVAIASYLGKSDKFDQAIAEYAEGYADQNERDFSAFQDAVKEGRAQAETGV